MPQMTLLIRGHFMRATAPQMTGFQGHPIQGPCHCSKSISRPKLTHAMWRALGHMLSSLHLDTRRDSL
ncbi:hypothetical protein CEP53_003696 [Fusarium sp. AF-6]|nr:hypothetical protein CEP53_003696 [Fusarium sp. AF-6]